MFVSKKKVTALVLTLFMAITFTSACGNEGQSNQKSTNKNADVKGPATIVVTYFPYADHLIALGQVDRLAGVVNLKSLQNFKVYDSYLESGNIVDLGEQVSPEHIASLKPDLIIVSQNDKQHVEQLSKIATTVTVEATLDWQETIVAVARAIGEEAAAEQYITKFQALQNETATVIEKSGVKGKTALFAMPWEKSFNYWGSTRMSLYYEKLGFKPVDDLEKVGEISLEGIYALNPDYIFIGKDYANASEIKLEDLGKSAIWNSLDAVKNNKVFEVDTEILGPLAMGQYKGLEYMNQLFSGTTSK
ncbi:ABC transporter substrate-binding protein [Paenibacillus sp. L3-i20]|uniref:ABC transporter substrate-binding protein n=1 Tax=Paenibacillus sp. L3-i20 TaxID=2905833 RepID=UPI001EDDE9EC|nr:ABC transporter substrate-binding protein [Paenibacillus sp. L3-i20]GKU78024.1 staphyloferrin B ABC transporter substrate-binding protein SirA [Paenibacillus sp. L3-i20]